MKIVVTGGCGFIGSNLCVFLKEKIKNSDILSIDNLSRKGSLLNQKRLKSLGIKNIKKDISKDKSLKFNKKLDLIIDCCANPSIEDSKENLDKIIKDNFLTTKNILLACKKNNAKVIFLSTSRIFSIDELNKIINKKFIRYPIKPKYKINENFSTKGVKSIYGLTKLFSEELIKEFSYLYNIKYITNRCGLIAGSWQFGKQEQGLLSYFMKQHILKQEVKFIGYGGEGHQVRDVLNINDLCKLILIQIKKINKINNQTFNVGGGIKNTISIFNLKKMCEKITGNKCRIYKKKFTSNYDIPYYVTNNSKVRRVYKWSPETNVYKTLYNIYEWQTKNKKILDKF